MPFRAVARINPDRVEQIIAWLDNMVEPHLVEDVSNYAKGRRRAWFPIECPLSDRQSFKPGLKPDRLWEYCVNVLNGYDFVPEAALVSKGGEISEHRDAAYAQFRAFGINLGRCDFHYRHIYPNFEWAPPNQCLGGVETVYRLTGGEIFEFNCKNPHWVTNVDPDRYGINLWRISTKRRAEFEQLKFLSS